MMILPFVLAADFMNFTYHSNPCEENVPVAVVMRKGSFSYWDQKMAVGFDLSVDFVKEGSLARNTRQAVVVLECDFPLGGTAGAYLYDERGKKTVLLGKVGEANWGADWGEGPKSIHVRFARAYLRVDECGDDDCIARATTTYALRGGKLRKVSVQVIKPPSSSH